MKNRVYLDYAATTPTDPRVLKTMIPYFTRNFGNTSSLHSYGQEATEMLEEARRVMAQSLNAQKSEIVFTSSATESNNFALKGIAFANKNKGNHIIISAIEHACVLNSAQWLEKQGFEISKVKVNKKGIIDLEDLEKKIRKDTILVSIMHANNEIGTIQPIKELATVAHKNDIIFHTDAVQTVGQLKIDVNDLGVDLLSISAHKFNGPKGIGALFVRQGVELVPQMSGGSQERKRRAGTANLAAAVGMGKAAEIAFEKLAEKRNKLILLRDYFISELFANFDEIKVNGTKDDYRLPGNINISFKNLDSESILFNLSLNDIAASTGSACASGSLSVSHVLKAIALEEEYIKGTIRFSLGFDNTKEEIDYVINKLKNIIDRLKSLK